MPTIEESGITLYPLFQMGISPLRDSYRGRLSLGMFVYLVCTMKNECTSELFPTKCNYN